MMNGRRLSLAVQIAILAAVYLAAGELGLSLARETWIASPVWPPAGIALAALLLFGRRLWPGIALGAFLVNLFAGVPFAGALLIATGNTLEAVVGASLLHRYGSFRNTLERTQDVLGLVALAVTLCTMISASIGTVVFCWLGPERMQGCGHFWLTWWLGDALGSLVLAPFLLTWISRPLPRLSARQWGEGALLLGTLMVVALLVFGGRPSHPFSGSPLAYNLFPFLIWAALRFGQRGVTAALLVLAAVAIASTVATDDPRLREVQTDRLLLLQAFLGVVAVTVLILAAVIGERQQAEAALRDSEALYASLVQNLPQNVFRKDAAGHLTFANERYCLLLRRSLEELLGKTDYDLFPRELAVKYREDDRVVIETGKILETVEEHQLPDGRKIYVQVVKSPVHDAQGQLIGTQGIFWDITERKRAEETLRESEDRFHTFMNNCPAIAFMKDEAGRLVYVNSTFERVFSMRRENWLGKNDFELWPPETARQLRDNDVAILAGGKPVEVEETVLREDGLHDWLSFKFPFRDAAGKRYLAGMAIELTERKRAEEALRASERRLALILDATNEGVWDWNIRTGEVYFSPRWIESLGYSAAEVSCDIGFWESIVHPEDMPRVQEALREHFEGRTPLYQVENRLRTRSGAYRWNLDRGKVVERGPGGQPLRMLGTNTDITDLKRAEAALRQSEQRYRTLVETARDAIFTLSPEGGFTSLNPAFETLTGWPRAEWLRQPLTALVDPADAPVVREVLQRGLLVDPPSTFEIRVRTQAREVIIMECTVTPQVQDGKVIGLLGIARDITERKRLEEQFRQAQKMEAVGQLAGGVAHDFNNLLTVVTGYSNLLLAALPPLDPSRESLEEIRKAGDRAAVLTRQLLAFSRRQVLQPRILDLNRIVLNMDRMLRRVIGEHIQLVTLLDPALRPVKADPGQLEQVILNLAVNARDAMPQGGRFVLSTSNMTLDDNFARAYPEVRPGPYVMLAASDTGCGMDEKVRARVFEPFFTTKEVGQGTGLGLAMVYGIIKQSSGHVAVESAPGQGATFRIYLPENPGPVATEAASPAPARDSARGKEVILLVEDDDEVRTLAARILQGLGYTVLLAANGWAALRICEQRSRSIDLLVTDVVMPLMSGRELAERLLQLYPHLKVLYISGYMADDVLRHGVWSAGSSFLQKPFEPDALARKVREMIDA